MTVDGRVNFIIDSIENAKKEVKEISIEGLKLYLVINVCYETFPEDDVFKYLGKKDPSFADFYVARQVSNDPAPMNSKKKNSIEAHLVYAVDKEQAFVGANSENLFYSTTPASRIDMNYIEEIDQALTRCINYPILEYAEILLELKEL